MSNTKFTTRLNKCDVFLRSKEWGKLFLLILREIQNIYCVRNKDKSDSTMWNSNIKLNIKQTLQSRKEPLIPYIETQIGDIQTINRTEVVTWAEAKDTLMCMMFQCRWYL